MEKESLEGKRNWEIDREKVRKWGDEEVERERKSESREGKCNKNVEGSRESGERKQSE